MVYAAGKRKIMAGEGIIGYNQTKPIERTLLETNIPDTDAMILSDFLN